MPKRFISMAEVSRNERALLQCWPALETVSDGSWLGRFAQGYTGRANSVQCLDAGDGNNVGPRLSLFEEHYSSRGLTPMVRLTPLTTPELEAELVHRNWIEESKSIVMVRAFQASDSFQVADNIAGMFEPHSVLSGEWRAAMHDLLSLNSADAHTFNAMTQKMPDLARGYLVRSEEKVVAGVLANIFEGIGNVFALQVHPHARRQGIARALMNEVLVWMKTQSVQTCALQVTQANLGACALYGSLGFETAYTYTYRAPVAVHRS